MLACPKCASYMFPGQKRGVQIDCCSGCKGIWLDSGELAQIAKTDNDLPQEDFTPSPTQYPCPHCGVKLATRQYSHQEPMMVDLCTRCNGIYLDNGEMQKIDALSRTVETSFPAPHQERMEQKAKRSEALSAIYKTETPAAKSPLLDRMSFINKVYMLLVLTLVVTAGTAYYGVISGTAIKYFWPAIIGELVLLVIALCVRRMPVVNMLTLFGFCGLSGYTLAAVLTVYLSKGLGNIVWQAAALTGAIFLVLSVYVHITKQDFQWMGALLFVGLVILIISGIGFLFFPNEFAQFIWSCVSAFLFSGFILFDTSRIILKYDTEEVVAAVLDLYLDIVNLFLDLLRILSYLSRK